MTIGSEMRTAVTRFDARTASTSKSCGEAAAVQRQPERAITHRTASRMRVHCLRGCGKPRVSNFRLSSDLIPLYHPGAWTQAPPSPNRNSEED